MAQASAAPANTGATSTTTKTTPTDPLWSQALQQAQAAIAAEQAPILSQEKASDAYYQQRQNDAIANAEALSNLLKGIGPAVQSTYDTAAQNQDVLAKGFSDGMQAALTGNTDNLNAMLAKLGSPTTLDSHAAEAGDVLQGLGGLIPGAKMTREGAAFGAAADMLPGTALLQGQQNAKALSMSAIKADQDFQNKLMTVASKLPGDAESNYMKLEQLALDNKKFALQVQNSKFDQAYKTASLNLKQQNQAFDQQYKTQTLALSGKRLQLEAAKFAQQQIQQDRQYKLSLARFGLSQKSLQLRIASEEFKLANGGFTPTQIAKWNGLLLEGLSTMPQGTTYQQYVSQAVSKGIPISLAIKAANQHWPATQRPDPGTLAPILNITQAAAAAATGFNATQAAYNQTTGTIPNLGPMARRYGLDPMAVLAVAAQEGLGGGVGDNGTSFGPWQMHIGGALPNWVGAKGAAFAQKWAWSPAGIDYALRQMAQVARGLTGNAAIQAIVTRFERPANPNREVAGAEAAYGRG